jgi:hypothetical protein
MRLLLWKIIAASIALSLSLIGAVVVLASAAPFHPGQALFPIQVSVEQGVVVLNLDPTDQALQELDMLDRRIADLRAASGSPGELAALAALENELGRTLTRLTDAPQRDAPLLLSPLARELQHASDAMALLSLAPERSPAEFALLRMTLARLAVAAGQPGQELKTLAQAEMGAQIDHAAPISLPTAEPGVLLTPGAIDPRMVLFPPGSPGAVHAFFPLTGKHELLPCQDCHANGMYAGTPNQCAACHASDEPANHFKGDCAACHNTSAWTPAHFDHAAAGATDCVSCHSRDKPANHFAGQCSACHTTQAWKPASFNHAAAGATDCVSCHSRDKPANHFAGQCSACHTTQAWKPASFNHAAAGATDCAACHAKDKPANHFDGQCSNCHNTNSWQGASFDHTFPINHGGAGGVCAKCHPSGTASWTCFTCHDQAKLTQKHSEEGILNIVGNCLACHPGGKGGDD